MGWEDSVPVGWAGHLHCPPWDVAVASLPPARAQPTGKGPDGGVFLKVGGDEEEMGKGKLHSYSSQAS